MPTIRQLLTRTWEMSCITAYRGTHWTLTQERQLWTRSRWQSLTLLLRNRTFTALFLKALDCTRLSTDSVSVYTVSKTVFHLSVTVPPPPCSTSSNHSVLHTPYFPSINYSDLNNTNIINRQCTVTATAQNSGPVPSTFTLLLFCMNVNRYIHSQLTKPRFGSYDNIKLGSYS
jgi:hypothetical protein